MKPTRKSTYERLSEVLADDDSSALTASKAASLLGDHLSEKWRVSGLVMTNERGMICIVDKSAVRWLSREEFWWLMHDSEAPLNKD